MKSTGIWTVALCVLGSALALGQDEAPRLPAAPANAPAPSLQSTADPGYAALIATCKTPPPARGGRPGGGGGGRPGGAPGGGAPAAGAPGAGARPGGVPGGAAPAGAPGGAQAGGPRGGGGQAAGPREYKVTEIPGVIAAGQRWKFVWQEAGNNGDGIVGTKDGALLLAQNDNSKVLKIDKKGKVSVAYSDTHTGGALSMSPKGALFVNQRGLHAAVMQLAPQRKVLADKYNGDPLDCLGGVINDLTADSKGGVYFTMGGLFYASPMGVVTRYGENLTTNGVILSANEKTVYVTNGATLAAFDVQPDGSLKNQREFVRLESGGDGSTIDAAGRIYVTINAGVQVISPDGKSLGVIPTPRNVISAAFGGKDKKMLYILARGAKDAGGTEVANAAQVYMIQMLAQGYKGRAK